MEKRTPVHSTHNAKWWVLVSVGIGTFMSALDGSVVNATLPTITAFFNSHVSVMEWVVTIYLLTVSCLLLAFGRLGDMQGHKRIYISGYVIFILSSALCGLSTSPGMLVAFRALQAIGAAMLFANSPAILTSSFPPKQRGQALGLQATLTYLGLTVGPSLGGWLTQQFGWRAIFYINIPVGLAGLVFCLLFIQSDKVHTIIESFDWKGALIFMVGLVSLLFVLNQAHSWGWSSAMTLGLLAFSVCMLVLFIRVEKYSKMPMLDLTLFRRRAFSASAASALLNYICMYTITFLIPFYLIQGRHFSPAYAGLILTAQPIVMAIVAPISGFLSDRISPRFLATSGMLVLAVGMWRLSQLGPASSIEEIAISLGIAGLGTGLFVSPNTNVLLGSAPRNRQGIASGIMATSRNVGMVLGVGLAGAIFTTVLAQGASLSSDANFFPAIQWSFVAAIFVALFGAFTSLLRGRDWMVEEGSAPVVQLPPQ